MHKFPEFCYRVIIEFYDIKFGEFIQFLSQISRSLCSVAKFLIADWAPEFEKKPVYAVMKKKLSRIFLPCEEAKEKLNNFFKIHTFKKYN